MVRYSSGRLRDKEYIINVNNYPFSISIDKGVGVKY
jgi:hypothetical protein